MKNLKIIILILTVILVFVGAFLGIKKDPTATPLFFGGLLGTILYLIMSLNHFKNNPNANEYTKAHPTITFICKFRYYFLIGSILLVLMSLLVFSDSSANGFYALFGALFNISLYFIGANSKNKVYHIS